MMNATVLTRVSQMGAQQGDPRYGNEWEDDDEDDGQPQCATQ
jgi:DnaJ family protein A protein 2